MDELRLVEATVPHSGSAKARVVESRMVQGRREPCILEDSVAQVGKLQIDVVKHDVRKVSATKVWALNVVGLSPAVPARWVVRPGRLEERSKMRLVANEGLPVARHVLGSEGFVVR